MSLAPPRLHHFKSSKTHLVIRKYQCVSDDNVFPTGRREDNYLCNIIGGERLTPTSVAAIALAITRQKVVICSTYA